MKRIFFLILIFIGGFNLLCAQGIEEWTQQKQTQKKYLVQQIAALEVYLDYAKKGYNVARTGLTTIRDIKNGELNLHSDFFASLAHVNPKIKGYVKIAGITALQLRIIKNSRQTMKDIREGGLFTGEELSHCKIVFDNLLESCLQTIDVLSMIITDDSVYMTDDERIKRIDALYADMQNKFAFCTDFSNEISILSIQRYGEQIEMKRFGLNYGLH